MARAKSSWPPEPPSWETDGVSAVTKVRWHDAEDMTYVDDRNVARGFPVVGVEDNLLETEDVLEVVHKGDEIARPPPLLLALAVILDVVPAVFVTAERAVVVVQHGKSCLGHVLRQLCLALAVLLERTVHDGHGRAGIVEEGGDEGAETCVLGEGSGAGCVADTRGWSTWCDFREEAKRRCVLEDALDDFLR